MDKYDERALIIFRHFIEFLKIYGQENFGESYDIRWSKVFKFTTSYHLLDFREDLENIIFEENDEIFRDKIYSWIENQILNGYPIWRFFKINNWLYEKLEQEFREKEIENEKKIFEKTKCFKCKFFEDKVSFINDKGYPTPYVKETYNGTKLLHRLNCLKRKEIIENSGKHHRHHFISNIDFEYDKFEEEKYRSGWRLKVDDHENCPYYTLNEDETYESFKEKYGEMI